LSLEAGQQSKRPTSGGVDEASCAKRRYSLQAVRDATSSAPIEQTVSLCHSRIIMTSVEVFWGGEPEHQSEREFLAQLRAELEGQQHGALILANFYLSGGLQVDFLIITPDRLCHIE